MTTLLTVTGFTFLSGLSPRSPRLLRGSCTSVQGYASGFLPTPPHGDAVASAWLAPPLPPGDFHPQSIAHAGRTQGRTFGAPRLRPEPATRAGASNRGERSGRGAGEKPPGSPGVSPLRGHTKQVQAWRHARAERADRRMKVTATGTGTPRIVQVGPSSVKDTPRSFLTASQKHISGPTLKRGSSADTPARNQGPGGSLPGPGAGHPRKVRASLLKDGLRRVEQQQQQPTASSSDRRQRITLARSVPTGHAREKRTVGEQIPRAQRPLPNRWTTPVPYGQPWNVGPAHGQQRTVLVNVPTPTDQDEVTRHRDSKVGGSSPSERASTSGLRFGSSSRRFNATSSRPNARMRFSTP